MISAEDLNWFNELATRLNMTRASERIGISQPALSHWLKKLEANLGKPLFRRSKQGLELTEFGQKLQHQSAILKQNWQDFIREIESDEKILKAKFHFGIHASVGLFFLPLLYKNLYKQAPGIRLNLVHGPSRFIMEDVISKRVDLGIVVNPTKHPDLVIKELYKDEIKLFSKSGEVKKRIIYNPNLIHGMQLIEKLKNLPEETIESDSLELITQLALAGEGMAILPERVAKTIAGNKLTPVGTTSITDGHCLIYRPTLRESKAGLKILEIIRNLKI